MLNRDRKPVRHQGPCSRAFMPAANNLGRLQKRHSPSGHEPGQGCGHANMSPRAIWGCASRELGEVLAGTPGRQPTVAAGLGADVP